MYNTPPPGKVHTGDFSSSEATPGPSRVSIYFIKSILMHTFLRFTKTFAFLIVIACGISAVAQSQLPTRIPYFKPKNTLVQAAPLTGFVVDSITPADLVSMLLGPGAAISNLTYTGSPLALGSFVDSISFLGLDSGVVISTGNAADLAGPNVSSCTSTDFGLPGDSMLQVLAGFPTFDASVIEFDVLVLTDTLMCKFVFGSEEYPEFVNANFNDIFAFFVSGPGLSGNINMALLPGTSIPISINNVNAGTNSQYYIDNATGLEVELDGLTVPITCYLPVQNGQTYHFRIAISDAADRVFDSGIFLKKKSVLGYACMPVPNFSPTISGMTVQFTNTTNYAQYYVWNYGDGMIDTTTAQTTAHTYAAAGNYTVVMSACNFYQIATCTQTIAVGGAGIDDPAAANQDISLVPSGSGIFRIKATHPGELRVSVYSVSGNCVRQLEANGQEEILIDLNGIPRGVYVIRAINDGRTITWKAIR